MRLLNTETLELREFFDNDIPRYAILSHTWEKEEILFQDMADITSAERKHGFQKLKGACKLARTQSFDYIWIDTCCIDKSSSAELTEAINSMYRWYKEAAVCYAYLSDVDERRVPPNMSGPSILEKWTVAPQIRKSRWFSRGWTLQELIAPPELEFYSLTWHKLGNKKLPQMTSLVSEVTGVDVDTLLGGDPTEVSIARRMFWASKRKTTRLEDRAYSLLGLFDVNMPLIYGEGNKAFRRLQEEILRTTDDQSIFAWHNSDYSEGKAVDVLAASPSDFAGSGVLSRQPFVRVGREPMVITSQGISCQLPLIFAVFLEPSRRFGFAVYRLKGHFKTNQPKHFYRVMTAEMTTFEAYSLPSLLDDSPVLGLDPTQLDKDAYVRALDTSYLQWKLASIIFTRQFPTSAVNIDKRQVAIPWSLSLLSDDYPPDNTPFWFVTFGTGRTKVEVIPTLSCTFPANMWDPSSMQFRVPPIEPRLFGVGEFQIVDGVFDLEVSRCDNDHRRTGLVMCIALVVGRQAVSRRVSPQPWCRVLDGVVDDDDAEYLVGGSEWAPERKGWETSKSILEAFDYVVEAAVQTKEISGVYYHVVTIQARLANQKELGLYLLNKKYVSAVTGESNEELDESAPIRYL